MAYTNGVFFIDLYSGSDTARTALTSCVASNPSGSVTSIAKTGHGLTTGAIVDLTAFTAWLNGAWKITVTDANNFTLDDATWQTTADPDGTVTPRGGSSWADAWLTITSGATAARIQPGDEIRVSKTPDPVSLGQSATFTDGSQDVVLTTAVTKKIEDAISGWTASTNITASTNTTRKMGATAHVFTPASGFTTGKVAYKAIAGGGTQDFSAYQKISFWFRPTSSVIISANTYKICLCSDSTGDTIVNEINIPATLGSALFHAMVLDYGAALGSNIQSVAIYANSDPGTTAFSINNIFATNDLDLKTLIGKTGDVNYNIQSIDDTTIKIDTANTAATGRGYSGTTSTETIYYCVPYDVTSTTVWQTLSEAGDSARAMDHYIGGYNTSNDTRDGRTVIASTIPALGTAINPKVFNKLSYFTFARFSTISTGVLTEYENCVFCGGSSPFSAASVSFKFIDCKFLNLSTTITIGGTEIVFINCEFRNSNTSGISAYAGTYLYNCIFANNTTSSIVSSESTERTSASVFLRNCTLLDSTEISFTANRYSSVWSYNHDNTDGNHWGFFNGATVNWQTSTVHSSEPGAWKFILTSNSKSSFYPARLKIAEPACAAGELVTVTAWVKKDHATNVGAKLLVEDELYNVEGVVADSATKANDTSWEQLTITFTPDVAGVVPIYVDAWYVSGASNVYIGSITVTQA